METTIRHRFLQDRKMTVTIIALLFLHSTGCGAPSTIQTPSADTRTTTAQSNVPIINNSPTPTRTPSQTPTRSIPANTLTPTTTPTMVPPTSAWKSGWVDFINGYYGYAISVPPSAKVSKNDRVDTYNLNELPADWNEKKDNYFDYLNMTYPPGLCVTIEYRSKSIQIKVADWLGGKYKDCAYVGGIGAETNIVWDWSEEDMFIGDKSYTPTILRLCESHEPGAKCGEPLIYTLSMDAGMRISLGITGNPQASYDQPLDDLAVMFEILRTYREIPRTELYCPQPVPTRLSAGGYAFVSTDPPLKYNNVRSAPGINQSLIGSIAPGKVVELLEGPICNNSLQWWKVRVPATGLVGWTPEGDHRSYWLIPCESKEKCGR